MARPDTLQLAQWPLEAAPRVPHEYPHVVHVAQELGAGPWRFVTRVIAELDDMGFSQSLITIGNSEKEPVAARVTRRHLPRVHGVLARRRLLARALDQITARSGPVTVHLHANGPGLPERLLLASLRGRAARLFTPHGTPLLNPRRRLVRTGHWLLEGAAGLLPITPVGRGVGEAQTLARAWGRAAFVLEHPVDDCYFAVEPQPEQPPVILGMGRATEHNAPELFAQLALRFEIDEMAAQFVWIGDGDPAQEARLRASGVHVTRRLEDAQIAAMLSRTAVFLQTSVWEGMPAALVSAMAAGVACVVADVGGHRDVVVHGRTGFIVRDLDDFDRHVRWLLEDVELRTRLGEAARRECRQRFARERFRQALHHLYATARGARAATIPARSRP